MGKMMKKMMGDMKGSMTMMSLRPSKLKEIMGCEKKADKAKIIGFAALMAAVAGYYQSMFDHVIYRSGQWQRKAYAGEVIFIPFYDKYADDRLWFTKNDLDVLNDVDFKDLVYLQNDWHDEIFQRAEGETFEAMNANHDHRDNTSIFTQKQRFNEWLNYRDNKEKVCQEGGEIECDNRDYENWEKLHRDVIWYDTAPCVFGPFIGQINYVAYGKSYNTDTRWFEETDGAPNRKKYDENGNPDDESREGWDMNLRVADGGIRWNNDWIYKDFVDIAVEVSDDCDVDC